MATKTIKLKRSTSPGAKPSGLEDGEVAVNITDGRFYTNRQNDTGWFTNDRHIISSHMSTITEDVVIEDGFNAMSVGPITVEDSATVSVPSDSVWLVL